jgi:hypothetical protein
VLAFFGRPDLSTQYDARAGAALVAIVSRARDHLRLDRV